MMAAIMAKRNQMKKIEGAEPAKPAPRPSAKK